MKKVFFPAVFLTLFASANTFGSDLMVAPHVPSTLLTAAAADTAKSTERPEAAVEAKVTRSFATNFKNVQAPRWYEDKGYYLASFQVDDRAAMVWFNKAGRIVNRVYYGSEKHLPAAEKELISFDYKDYQIGATQEVHTLNGQAWVVGLQNCSHIVKVRIMNGEIQELERFQKSK